MKLQVRRKHRPKDQLQTAVRHVRKRHVDKVSQKTVRHRLAPAARRTHCADKGDVEDGGELIRLAVVPSLLVIPLAEDFDRRLRAVLLTFRHVEVVDKDGVALPDRRAVEPFVSLVEFPIEKVLRLVRGCLRGERDEDRRVC
eukprot:3935159-Rhodomonas_salina.1